MTRQVLFDATRLVTRTERGAPTGIDRVCLAYAEWLMAHPGVEFRPVRTRKGSLVAVSEAWFATQIADMRARWNGTLQPSSTAEETALFRALASGPGRTPVRSPEPEPGRASRSTPRLHTLPRLMNSRRLPPHEATALYINVGHTGLEDDAVLSALRRSGVQCVVFLHDLIPITHPEYCRPGDDERHAKRVATTLTHAGAIIVNSQATAGELRTHAGSRGMPCPDVVIAHLGIEPAFSAPPKPADSLPPYFVFVGTIEARKNLALLLTIWARLAARLGAEAPQLVLVGRYGWENEAVLDHLERSPLLQTLVHHVTDISDAALVRLMVGARAVLAPSSVEGFDLPAVEARALGVPLLASDIAVHRELTPDAMLIDPLDGLGWLEQLLRVSSEPAQMRPAITPPNWTQHFEQVGRALRLV